MFSFRSVAAGERMLVRITTPQQHDSARKTFDGVKSAIEGRSLCAPQQASKKSPGTGHRAGTGRGLFRDIFGAHKVCNYGYQTVKGVPGVRSPYTIHPISRALSVAMRQAKLMNCALVMGVDGCSPVCYF